VPGQRLAGKGETMGDNLFKAIDEAVSKAEKQLKRYHDKLVDHR
jgi:ribosome-associated translation inhibitor RaiA